MVPIIVTSNYTYHGLLLKLVEAVAFETTDPAMRREMTVTTSLVDANCDTDLCGVHEGLPLGVAPAADEYGWQQSLKKLAALVEAR